MFDDSSAWGTAPDLPTEDIVKDTIQKDQTIKEITAAQEDLRGMSAFANKSTIPKDIVALVSKVHGVQADIDKLTSDNATLQIYIDNLTMQMAKRR